jgi:MFS family permease
MISLLRQRNFSLLWFAGMVSVFGDWILFVALPFYVYKLTSSALITGTMFIAQTLPRILFGLIAGVFVDRWNRKWVMILADLIRMGLLLLLFFIHSKNDIWIAYVVAFVEAAITQFFLQAKNAAIPSTVNENHLVSANGLNSLSENMARIAGPALGGILLNLFGIASDAVLDSISFLISGILIALIVLPTVQNVEQLASDGNLFDNWRKLWQDGMTGLALVSKDRLISTIFLVVGLVLLAEGLITVLLVPFVTVALHGSAAELGWLLSGQGIGGVLGSLVVQVSNKRGFPKVRLIALTALLGGLLRLSLVNIPVFFVDMALIGAAGVVAIVLHVNISVVLQTAIPNQYLGRVFGIYETLQGITLFLGMVLASVLGDRLGVIVVLNGATLLYTLAGVIGLFLLAPKSFAEREAVPMALGEKV